MKKPFRLESHSKRKKPYVLGRYATRKDAEKAFDFYAAKNENSKELQKKFPNGHIEDLFCDLQIVGPEQ